MKTRTLFLSTLLLLATVTIVSAKEANTNKMLISSGDDLRNSFREMIVHDMNKMPNYFYRNDVNKLDEDVEVVFFITPEKTVRLIKAKCENEFAIEYVKQLLNAEKFNIDDSMVGRTYKINIKLVYKTV